MDGDYLLWMDCRDINSPIIYISHDGPEIFVAASNFSELLEGLIRGYQSPTFKELKESAFGNYFETLVEIPKQKTTIPIIETSTTIQADFNHAKLGAGVNRKFFKKNFEPIETPTEIGTLTFEKLPEDIISRRKRNNFILYAVIFLLLIGITTYVHLNCDPTCPKCNPNCVKECGNWLKSMFKGFLYTIATLFALGCLFSLIADSWYSWKDKQNAKK